jgi:hypothetical protein
MREAERSPPLQNSCHLPISKASEVTLQVLRQKTGNCGSFRPDGTTRRVVNDTSTEVP